MTDVKKFTRITLIILAIAVKRLQVKLVDTQFEILQIEFAPNVLQSSDFVRKMFP